VNFLVDANLPPRLCQWLHHHGHHATHLLELQSIRLPDRQVWGLAATRQDIIITKDSDFYERSLLLGKPPQVLLIALGNCSNDELLKHLNLYWKHIETELSAGPRLIVARPTHLEIFP
jgi:predicted nuclease of predicted toxin-antitoxin system